MKSHLIPLDFDASNPDHVNQLQDVLAFFGYRIDLAETVSKILGLSTKEALYKFSKALCLTCSCEISETLISEINKVLSKCFRIKGTLTNKDGVGIEGLTVQVYQYFYKEDTTIMLGETKSVSGGSYCAFIHQPSNSIASATLKSGFINSDCKSSAKCLPANV